MSLIFKALQRFQQPGVVPKDEGDTLAPQRKGYAFSKIFLAPVFLLGAAVALLVVGIIIFHNMAWFSSGGRQLPTAAEAAQPETIRVTGKIDSETMEMAKIDEPDPFAQPPVNPVPEVNYQLHTPGDTTPAGLLGSASIKDAPSNDVSLVSTGKGPAFKPHLPDEPVSANHNPALPKFAFVAQDAGSPAIGHGPGMDPGNLPAYPQHTGTHLAIPHAINEDGDKAVDRLKMPAMEPQDHKKPILQQQHQAKRATRHLKIARLVDEIHGAIRTGEVAQAARLLDKLVQLKGANDSFVTKLKAFSYIKQSRLEEARSLLTRVLSIDADDLEAGLNMAVIDIKSGRYEEARSRLTELQAIYPEKDQVAIYLKQLPR